MLFAARQVIIIIILYVSIRWQTCVRSLVSRPLYSNFEKFGYDHQEYTAVMISTYCLWQVNRWGTLEFCPYAVLSLAKLHSLLLAQSIYITIYCICTKICLCFGQYLLKNIKPLTTTKDFKILNVGFTRAM